MSRVAAWEWDALLTRVLAFPSERAPQLSDALHAAMLSACSDYVPSRLDLLEQRVRVLEGDTPMAPPIPADPRVAHYATALRRIAEHGRELGLMDVIALAQAALSTHGH